MKPEADGTIPFHQPHCLGCGPENPANMGLKLRVAGERVLGKVRFDRRQEGRPALPTAAPSSMMPSAAS